MLMPQNAALFAVALSGYRFIVMFIICRATIVASVSHSKLAFLVKLSVAFAYIFAPPKDTFNYLQYVPCYNPNLLHV